MHLWLAVFLVEGVHHVDYLKDDYLHGVVHTLEFARNIDPKNIISVSKL